MVVNFHISIIGIIISLFFLIPGLLLFPNLIEILNLFQPQVNQGDNLFQILFALLPFILILMLIYFSIFGSYGK